MSKYDPLEKHLKSVGYGEIPMTFDEIESLISGGLPPSARRHRAWWSNNPSNSVCTYAWLAAGYKTADVNLEGETVVFVKTSDPQPTADTDSGSHTRPGAALYGALKGSVHLDPDVDLTAPADPDWGRAYD